MEQDILISVIIPVYNVKQYLEKCVKSVCNQTYQNLEIILVDDGSTDGSETLCDRLAQEDNRIKVIHKQNGGLSDARNAGMDIMKGQYVGFVDGDDWIEPTMYEQLLEACLTHACKVAACRYKEIYEWKEEENASTVNDQNKSLSNAKENSFMSICLSIQEAVLAYIQEAEQPAIYHCAWSKLYEVAFLDGMRFIKGRKSEDIPFWGELASKLETIAYVDAPLYDYNKIREGSIMNVKSMEHTFDHEIVGWKEEFAFFEQSNKLMELSLLAKFYFYWRMLSYAKVAKEDPNQALFYEKLVDLLLQDKKEVRRACKHPNANKKYALRLQLFVCSPKLYWVIDGRGK